MLDEKRVVNFPDREAIVLQGGEIYCERHIFKKNKGLSRAQNRKYRATHSRR